MTDSMVEKAIMLSALNADEQRDNIKKIEYKVFTSTDPERENKWFKEYVVVSFQDGAKTIRDITGLTKSETRRIVVHILAGVDSNDPRLNSPMPTEEDGWAMVHGFED